MRGTIYDAASLVIMRRGQGNPMRMMIESFRVYVKDLIMSNGPQPEGAIVQAMILGDQKTIPSDVQDTFNRTGTSHIIAISGFNVGMIAFCVIFLIRSLLKASPTLLLHFNIMKISMVLAMIPVMAFAFIAGMGVSVVRAAIMTLLFMASILVGRSSDLYNTLALAAFLILLFSPSSLFDVSFQLTFAALISLLYLTPCLVGMIPGSISNHDARNKRLTIKYLYHCMVFIAVTISAIVGTLPLVVHYFNRISISALPANLIVVPVMGILALPIVMLIPIAGLFSFSMAVFLIHLSTWLVHISMQVVSCLSDLAWAGCFIGTPGWTAIAFYYFFLFFLVMSINRRNSMPEDGMEDRPYHEHVLARAVPYLAVIFFFYSAFPSFTRTWETDCRRILL